MPIKLVQLVYNIFYMANCCTACVILINLYKETICTCIKSNEHQSETSVKLTNQVNTSIVDWFHNTTTMTPKRIKNVFSKTDSFTPTTLLANDPVFDAILVV